MKEKIGSIFNAIILLGFATFAIGAFVYVTNLLLRLRLSLEIFVIVLGILILIFGVAGARVFSALELAL